MPTAAAPRGSGSVSLWKQETTFGVAASGNYMRLPYYSDNLAEKQALQTDPLLGLSLQNARDPSDPAPDLPALAGQVAFPLDLAFCGFPLNMVFGAPVTTGTTPNYQHVFSSGLDILPHWTRELQLGSNLFHQALGVVGQKLTFDIGRKGGFDRVMVDFLGRKDGKLTATAGGTPAAMLTRVPVIAALPIFKLDSVAVADVLSMNLVYDNGIVARDDLGDAAGYPLGHDTDNEPSCTGSIKARLRGTALWDQAKQMPSIIDAAVGEVLWQINANRSLSLAMAAMYLEPAGAPITGMGRIEQTFNFRCSQTAAAAMLVATLKSPTATFP